MENAPPMSASMPSDSSCNVTWEKSLIEQNEKEIRLKKLRLSDMPLLIS